MISLLVPCYNESEVLRTTYSALVRAAQRWSEPVEFVFVDDGSQDDTWQTIEQLGCADPRVKGVRLSRNFGHQAAIGAGLERVTGDAVIVMDADLQDPPELIDSMLEKWRAGYDVVYAQRNCRLGESVFKRVTGHVFYRMLERFQEVPIPRDVGDFALMDARIVRLLLGFQEHAIFWRGLRCWAGFRHTAVRFDRPPRAAGTTKYSLTKLAKLASDGLLSFSPLPLRLALYLGAVTCFATLLTFVIAVIVYLATAGQTAIASPAVLVTAFMGSVQLMCLGLLGEYVNRIYTDVRGRPRWIVQSTLGMAENESGLTIPRRRAG
jgi:dolichol-phosphate mannosyltransferase